MLTSDIEHPVFEGLTIERSRSLLRGAQRAIDIIRARTRAGRASNGSPLPPPKSGGRPFARTGGTLDALRVLSVRGGEATIGVDGAHWLALNAYQSGAVGGGKAGTRAPVNIMDLSDAEASEVAAAMVGDVDQQVVDAEAQGSVFAYRTETVQGGRR